MKKVVGFIVVALGWMAVPSQARAAPCGSGTGTCTITGSDTDADSICIYDQDDGDHAYCIYRGGVKVVGPTVIADSADVIVNGQGGDDKVAVHNGSTCPCACGDAGDANPFVYDVGVTVALNGGNGADYMIGGNGPDSVNGDGDGDHVAGNNGSPDSDVNGGAGDDFVFDKDTPVLHGGTGNDCLVVTVIGQCVAGITCDCGDDDDDTNCPLHCNACEGDVTAGCTFSCPAP